MVSIFEKTRNVWTRPVYIIFCFSQLPATYVKKWPVVIRWIVMYWLIHLEVFRGSSTDMDYDE